MLFYTHHKKLKNIPDSYKKISISEYITMINIEGGLELNDLHPNHISKKSNTFIKRINKDFEKDEYRKFLKTPAAMKHIIFICLMLDSDINVVLVNHNKENIKYLKEICRFINKRYDYPYYKFKSINDINLDMKRDSVFDDGSRDKVMLDIKKYMGL